MLHLSLLCLVLIVASLLLLVHGEGSRDLTPADFTTTVFSKPTLVKFFAPWCGHCKALAPVWEEAAQLIHREHPNVQLVGLDCPAHQEVCRQFNVKGYPTIVYIRPTQSDEDLLTMSRDNPAKLAALPRSVYLYTGARTVLGFEHFVSNPEEWSRVTPTPYPLPLPAEPVPMLLIAHEQRVQAEVEGEAKGEARAAHDLGRTLEAAKAKLDEDGNALGGMIMGKLKARTGNSTATALVAGVDSWMLNTALAVVLLLIVVVGVFLALTARAAVKPNKVV